MFRLVSFVLALTLFSIGPVLTGCTDAAEEPGHEHNGEAQDGGSDEDAGEHDGDAGEHADGDGEPDGDAGEHDGDAEPHDEGAGEHDGDAHEETPIDPTTPHGGKYGRLPDEGVVEFLIEKPSKDFVIWTYQTDFQTPLAATSTPYLEIVVEGVTKKFVAQAVDGAPAEYRIPAAELEGIHVAGNLTVELQTEWSIKVHVH